MTVNFDRYESLVDAQRASRVRFGSLALVIVLLMFSVNSMISYDALRMAATSMMAAIVSLVAYLTVVSNRSAILAANFLVAAMAVQTFGEMLVNGGLQAPATPIALLIVPAAILLTKLRHTIGWMMVVSIGLISIAWLEGSGLTLPSELAASEQRQDKVMSLLIGAMASAALVGVFADQASVALRTLAREREEYERRAMHDALTQMPNRTRFCETALVQIEESRLAGHHCTLVFFDIDKFKQVNDGLGHEAGDELLIAFARRLEQSFQMPAQLGRFAGDEFVMSVTHDAGAYTDEKIVNTVSQMMAAPFDVVGATLTVSASFGVARLGKDGNSLTELLAAADQSMYAMKRNRSAGSETADQTVDRSAARSGAAPLSN